MAINPSIYKDKLLTFFSDGSRFRTETQHTLFTRNSIINELKQDLDEYPTRNFKEAHFIGGGGVASWFLPQFIKSLYNQRIAFGITDEFIITIYDYDVVENKNILRQNFILEDVGKNKAKVLSDRYNNIYPGIKVNYVDKYLYCKGFLNAMIKDRDRTIETAEYGNTDIYASMIFSPYRSYIFNFVDNETTKHQLDYYLAINSPHFNEVPYIDYLYFTTGCDVSNGQVFCKKFKYSENYTQYYKDITFDKGEEIIDDSISCAEIAAETALEQTFDSNTLAANLLNILVNNQMNKFWNTHSKEIKFVSGGSPRVETINSMENYNFKDYLAECRLMRRRY